MLIGHYAPALALHRTRPAIPLWVLFLAAQAVDILWGSFVLAGIEHLRIVPGFTQANPLDLYDMPYTHSVVAIAAWAVVCGGAWFVLRKGPDPAREALVVGLVVASHFVCDLLVHVHDLSLVGGSSARLGFGLWNHRELALLVEGALFIGAALWWWQKTELRTPRAAHVLRGMTVVLVVSFYLPAPTSPALMALTGLAVDLGCAFAIWWAMASTRGRSGAHSPS